MGGIKKAFLPVQGRPIVDALLETLGHFFSERMVITNDPLLYLPYDLPAYSDLFARRSPLNGVYSALSYALSPYVFVTPCDLPFIRPALIRLLLDELDPRSDAVVPRTSKGMEPLCAIYSQRCLKPARRLLVSGKLAVRGFYSQVRVKAVPEARLREADPDLTSFFNVNTPQDLETAQEKEIGHDGFFAPG